MQSVDDLHFRLPPYYGCPPWATRLTYPWDMRYRAGVRSRSVDSQDLPDLLLLRSCLAAVYLDLPRRSRFTLRANLRLVYDLHRPRCCARAALRQSISTFPEGLDSGCLCSLPRNRPVAWFPASPRWHVFRFPVSSFCFLPPTLIHFERSLSVRSP